MFRRFSVTHTSLLSAAAFACALTAACANSTNTEDTAPKKKEPAAADAGLTVPVPTGTLPAQGNDSGTPVADAAVGNISGPSFDLAKVSTIEGTFITEKAPVNGLQTNATVTWSFKIANITPPPSSTATWSAQATNVVNGNVSDFPPVSNLALSLGPAPSPAQYEFYGSDFGTPSNYVLIQHAEGRILTFRFYRRTIDNGEPQPPPDEPKSILYTVK